MKVNEVSNFLDMSRIRVTGALKKLPDVVGTENIETICVGSYNNATGVLILTDTRLFFYARVLLDEIQQDLNLKQILGVDLTSKGMHCTLTIILPGEKFILNNAGPYNKMNDIANKIKEKVDH
jgi:hypothetical protein